MCLLLVILRNLFEFTFRLLYLLTDVLTYGSELSFGELER